MSSGGEGIVLDFALSFGLLGPAVFQFVRMAGGERHRGLFPFPVPRVDAFVHVAVDGGRKVRRRLQSRCHVDAWVRDIVMSLNSMYTGSEDQGSFVEGGRYTLSQALCLQRLRDAVLDAGKIPDGITGQGALSELRTKTGYTGEPVNLVPLDVEKLSLPAAGSKAATLETILQGEAESFVHRLFTKLSADGVAKERMEAAGLAAPYLDPILKSSGRVYAQFCKRLEKAGVVEFHRSYKERVGAFAVAKKNGKQRLVIDARLANMHFEKPEKVRLATGSTFSRLEVDEGPPIEVGGVDIADAFYNIALPLPLRKFFALPGLQARDVGVCTCEGAAVTPGCLVYPVLRVVPMGWTHALWICQFAHEAVVNANPFVDSSLRIVDKREVPRLKTYLHTEYVDNFVVVTQKRDLAYDLADRIGRALRERGLPTHEVEAGKGLETLGWKFSSDHPFVQVTPKRMWKLRLATLELLKVGRCDGKLLERMIGHYTFAGLLNRGFLSIFQASYVFIRKHYTDWVELWPEVRRELFWACSLICLVRRDLSAIWSGTVHATDASFWGRGVTSCCRAVDEIRPVAAQCDRWRFSADEEKAVCEKESLTILQRLDPERLQLPTPCPHEIGSLDRVREVPLGFIGEDWSKGESAQWDRMEGIPTVEGRSVVWLGQHLARSQKNLGRRHLVLTDSMSVTLSLTKGRSSTRSLNRVCRQMAAIEMMSGMQFCYRWIPSELNPADFPSRAQALSSFSLLAGVQKLREGHAAKGSNECGSSWRQSALWHYEKELGVGGSTKVSCSTPFDAEGELAEAEERGIQGHQSRSSAPATWTEPGHGGQWSEELLRDSDIDLAQVEELSESLGGVRGLVLRAGDDDGSSPGLGPGSHKPFERAVLRRCRCGHCSNAAGGRQVLSRRCPKAHPPASEPGGHERLPKTGAGPGTRPNALAHGVLCGAPALGGIQGGGFVDPAHLGNVLKARRVVQASQEAFGGPVEDVPPLGGDSEPWGGLSRSRSRTKKEDGERRVSSAGGAVKSGRVGRSHFAGPTLSPRVGKTDGRTCEIQTASGQDLHNGSETSHVGLHPGHRRRRLSECRDQLHLSVAPRIGLNRCAGRVEKFGRGAEERPVASTEKCKALQQRRQSVPGFRRAERSAEGQCIGSRGMDGKDFRQWRPSRKGYQGIGLELFSGCGRFSRAVRKKLPHIFCVEVDIGHGPQFDLSIRRIQQEIFSLIHSGAVKYVWMGTPCNSWSRARRWDGRGPGPLRDDGEGLLGLPNLSPTDQKKVELGNALMRFSAKIFRMCITLDIPVVLENPHTSRLWRAPPIRHLMLHSHTTYFSTDFCQDGTPWRKRTGLLSSGLDLSYAVKSCTGPRGICSRTGLQHQHLEGLVNGQFRTLAAQPYPNNLCRRLATSFQNACMRRSFDPLWKFFLRP